MSREKIVMVGGVFNILHPGHIKFLEEAKKFGDKLIVIVARDTNIEPRRRIIPEDQRLAVISALKVVDKAVLGDEKDMFKIVEKIKPNVIVLGYDQKFDVKELKKELKRRCLQTEVIRIEKKFEGELYDTSKILERIKKQL